MKMESVSKMVAILLFLLPVISLVNGARSPMKLFDAMRYGDAPIDITQNCTFIGAENGPRIKTWASSLYSLASDITFENVVMKNTGNPIFIDQRYCPSGSCKVENLLSSAVQIKDVTFKNLRGTSTTKVTVNIQCSPTLPCKNIQLVDIDLSYRGQRGKATSLCSRVTGSSTGKQKPDGCV